MIKTVILLSALASAPSESLVEWRMQSPCDMAVDFANVVLVHVESGKEACDERGCYGSIFGGIVKKVVRSTKPHSTGESLSFFSYSPDAIIGSDALVFLRPLPENQGVVVERPDGLVAYKAPDEVTHFAGWHHVYVALGENYFRLYETCSIDSKPECVDLQIQQSSDILLSWVREPNPLEELKACPVRSH